MYHACRVILNTGVSSCEQVERERASKWIYVQCVLMKIGNAYGSCYDAAWCDIETKRYDWNYIPYQGLIFQFLIQFFTFFSALSLSLLLFVLFQLEISLTEMKLKSWINKYNWFLEQQHSDYIFYFLFWNKINIIYIYFFSYFSNQFLINFAYIYIYIIYKIK